MQTELKKDRTATRAFRIDESALERMQEDARELGVSLNTLVNQLFLAYANYDHYARKLRTIKMTSGAFRSIIRESSDALLTEASRHIARNEHVSLIMEKYGELTLGGALDLLRCLATYAKWFEYSEVSHGGRTTITLTHQFGSKGSVFLSSYVEALFEEVVGIHTKLRLTESSVIFTLEL